MIIRTQEDVTTAVLAELERSPDARFKEIMRAAIQHLHGFVRDARLTEAEFHQACAFVAKLAAHHAIAQRGGADMWFAGHLLAGVSAQ